RLLGQRGQGVGVDHGRADLGHLALVGLGPVLVEVLRRDQLQDGVAQVLETFVVSRREVWALVGEGAVGQGLLEEGDIPKGDPDPLLEVVQAGARDFDGAGYLGPSLRIFYGCNPRPARRW